MSDQSSERKPDDQEAEATGPKGFLKRLGPGLITGASNDDPSGIGTYSPVSYTHLTLPTRPEISWIATISGKVSSMVQPMP